jgi:hypothetical protein
MIHRALRTGVVNVPLEKRGRGVLEIRGGSVCLNRFWAFLKWFSALVTPLPHLAVAD